MNDGLTPAERVRIAAGFLLLAYALACAVYRAALHVAARRMDKRREGGCAAPRRAEGSIGQ